MAARTSQTPVTPQEAALLAANLMSEATFQAQVEAMAKGFGWRCYHTKFSQGSSAGFPDLVAVRQNRLVFAELKRQADRYKPTSKQQAWLDDLTFAATWSSDVIEVYLWRPLDITSTPNPILEVLR